MKRQSGFTLIEFMIAMGITLIALAATMLAFKDATNTNQSITLKSDLSDNLRAGVNLLEQDLIQAGTGIPTGGIPIPYTSGPPNCLGSGGAPINRPNLSGGLTFPVCNVTLNAVEPGWELGPPVTSPDSTPGARTDLITMLYVDNTLALNARMINEPAQGANPGCPGGHINNNGQVVIFDPTCIQFSPTGVQINSGDLISIAEVVRDLHRSESQPEQSYSERQLYESALDRMAREVAAIERIDREAAVALLTKSLTKAA